MRCCSNLRLDGASTRSGHGHRGSPHRARVVIAQTQVRLLHRCPAPPLSHLGGWAGPRGSRPSSCAAATPAPRVMGVPLATAPPLQLVQQLAAAAAVVAAAAAAGAAAAAAATTELRQQVSLAVGAPWLMAVRCLCRRAGAMARCRASLAPPRGWCLVRLRPHLRHDRASAHAKQELWCVPGKGEVAPTGTAAKQQGHRATKCAPRVPRRPTLVGGKRPAARARQGGTPMRRHRRGWACGQRRRRCRLCSSWPPLLLRLLLQRRRRCDASRPWCALARRCRGPPGVGAVAATALRRLFVAARAWRRCAAAARRACARTCGTTEHARTPSTGSAGQGRRTEQERSRLAGEGKVELLLGDCVKWLRCPRPPSSYLGWWAGTRAPRLPRLVAVSMASLRTAGAPPAWGLFGRLAGLVLVFL